jgi:uncharacterized membrane protein YhiD involved in acid resistance
MVEILFENLVKICLAVLFGGVIGAEREFQDKAAGFRRVFHLVNFYQA